MMLYSSFMILYSVCKLIFRYLFYQHFSHFSSPKSSSIAIMANTYLIISAVVAVVAIALTAAYMAGLLDPVIEEVGIMFFKAKAEAEAKKMQAQGMKEGEDFFKGMFPISDTVVRVPFSRSGVA